MKKKFINLFRDAPLRCAVAQIDGILVRLINLFAININAKSSDFKKLRLNGDKHSTWLHKRQDSRRRADNVMNFSSLFLID